MALVWPQMGSCNENRILELTRPNYCRIKFLAGTAKPNWQILCQGQRFTHSDWAHSWRTAASIAVQTTLASAVVVTIRSLRIRANHQE